MIPELVNLSGDPRGFFTRRDAIGLGLADRDLYRGLRCGQLVRLRHGSYAVAAVHGGLDEVQQHAVMTRAALGAQRGRVAAVGPSAAALHGLPVYGCDLSVVHLVRLDGGAPRNEAGVRHHVVGADLADQLMEIDGIALTSLVRTAWDVARFHGLDAGVVTADAVLRRVPALAADLEHLSRMHRQQPGARRAMIAVRLADGGAESAGESITRVRFYRFAIPRPILQFEVFDEDGTLLGRSDFGWPEFSHLGEFDGRVKYGRLLRDCESPGDVVFREKTREDLMRGRCYGMSRFIWLSVMDTRVHRSMAKLSASLQQSYRLFGSR